MPIAEYVKAIHPEDLSRVKAKIEQAMQQPVVFQEEYRLVQKDGSIRWIDARGKCQFDAFGRNRSKDALQVVDGDGWNNRLDRLVT